MKTALYRHFNRQGHLLYVGISLNALVRLTQHKDRSAWFDQIARVEIEWHDSRESALAAERAAILAEHPVFNIDMNIAKPVAWGVFHPNSGRLDGWYFTIEDASEMLEFFQAEFPDEQFVLMTRREGDEHRTGLPALRHHEAALWALSSRREP